jgi:hypothetical protein
VQDFRDVPLDFLHLCGFLFERFVFPVKRFRFGGFACGLLD